MTNQPTVEQFVLRKVQALRGPNIWADFPVLEAWIDLSGLKNASSESLPGLQND